MKKEGTTTEFIRKEIQATQKELAWILGIPVRTIENWDHRHCMPKFLNTMIHAFILSEWISFWDLNPELNCHELLYTDKVDDNNIEIYNAFKMQLHDQIQFYDIING